MEAKFWRDKWVSNQIGFHEDVVHPLLSRHWAACHSDKSARVFAPLCGKSKDLVWLRERGHDVVGVELSEIAAAACFEEGGISYEIDAHGTFERYHADGLTILCGDFFDLSPAILGPVDAIYDRAALIALPPETRKAYVKQIDSLAGSTLSMLLITLNYPPDEISPPPFLVSDDEVHALYGDWCALSILGRGEAKVKGVAGGETAFHLVAR